MTSRSIKEVAKRKNISPKTVENAIQHGFLKNHRLKMGHREYRIEDEDSDEYFDKPDYHDWISFKTACDWYDIPRDCLDKLRDEGKVKCKRYRTDWFTFQEDLSPYLFAEGLIETYPFPEFSSTIKDFFIVTNPRGVHLRPATVISMICKKYYPYTKLILEHAGEKWNYRCRVATPHY
ncbi:MAG: hypothetical protein H8E32_14330 [Nitrospinae bacterium]|nr:hypothetical protein [Nitrospinota bacterium]